MKKFTKLIATAAISFSVGFAIASTVDNHSATQPQVIPAQAEETTIREVISYEIEKIDAKISHLEERMEEGDLMPQTHSWIDAENQIKQLSATKDAYVKTLAKM